MLSHIRRATRESTRPSLVKKKSAVGDLILDLVPGSVGAYSVRKLRKNYSGSAFRVRRDSDNTEQNIGFDISGNLNTTALSTFLSGANGFITIWYDQAGSANLSQATQAAQPRILTGFTTSGKAAISFDGVNDFVTGNTGSFSGDQKTSFFNVFQLAGFGATSVDQPMHTIGDDLGGVRDQATLAFETATVTAIRLFGGNTAFTTSVPINQTNISNGLYPGGGVNWKFRLNKVNQTVGASSPGLMAYASGIVQVGKPRDGAFPSNFFDGEVSELIVYNTDKTANIPTIEADQELYYQSVTNLILDTVTGAKAAYGLRKLRAAYAGSAIRVRRSSDNAEQDIGFSGVGLDTASLATFIGGGNGFIVTWYDQAGSTNLTQATASAQAQILTAQTPGGKSGAKFDGSTDFYTSLTTGAPYANISILSVASFDLATQPGGDFDYLYLLGTTAAAQKLVNMARTASTNVYYSYDGAAVRAGAAITSGYRVFSQVFKAAATRHRFFKNGVEDTVSDYPSTPDVGGRLTLGRYQIGSTHYLNGRISEFLFFDSALSDINRQLIEADETTYYM